MYEQDGYHYLEIQNVHSDDSGMYVCTIENSAGTDAASAELDVFGELHCLPSLKSKSRLNTSKFTSYHTWPVTVQATVVNVVKVIMSG